MSNEIARGIWGDDCLTAAQQSAVARIKRAFFETSSPQIVRIVGPEHRGKTHTVQALLSSLTDLSTDENPALPWTDISDWRSSRSYIAMPTDLIRTSMGWWWTATRAVPELPNDLVGTIRQNALELLEGVQPATLADRLEPEVEDWWKLAARTALNVGVDRIPFFGASTVLGRAGRQGLQMRAAESEATMVDLAETLRPDAASDLLLALVVARLANVNEELPALPPLLAVVDRANHLSSSDLLQLEQVLTANPDDLLSEIGLPDSAVRAMRRFGMPPAFPVTVVLIEDTSTAGEAFIGPLGEKHTTDQPEPGHLETWAKEIGTRLRCPVTVVDDFPLATTDEALSVISHLLPDLTERQREAVASASEDPFLDGHNIALVRAHIQRVDVMTEVGDLDSSWVRKNLPQHLKSEIEAIADAATPDTRRALVAGALLGFGFSSQGLSELLERDSDEALGEAAERGLISIHGRQDEIPMHVFGDAMTYKYFRNLAYADQSLTIKTLSTATLPKARAALGWAYPAGSAEALKVAELAKGACWEYREIAEESDVSAKAQAAIDIWGAASALTGDRDMLLKQMGDDAASKRLQFLHSVRDLPCAEGQSIHAWAIIRRWFIHRLTPGPMSYGSIFSMAQRTDERPDRTNPDAHQLAVGLAARHFEEYPEDLALGWFDVQLALRLGPYARGLEQVKAGLLARKLLYAGMSSPAPVHYVASELWHVLQPSEREICTHLLGHWLHVGKFSDPVRSAALLAIRAPSLTPDIALDLLRDAFASKTGDDMFRDFEINGSLGDFTAPTVYPWNGLDVLTVHALMALAQDRDIGTGRGKIVHRLADLAGSHPSAVALIGSEDLGRLSKKKQNHLETVRSTWLRTGLVGHSEQATLPALS